MKKNKRFLVKLMVFALLAVALNALIDSGYNRWMYYFRLNRNQDRQFAEFNDTLKYLMAGNSHNITDPEILGNSFSYVTPRELYLQTYYKLRHVLEHGVKRPQYLLISVDPINFNPKAEKDLTFDGYWRKYIDYRELVRETGDYGYLLNWANGTFFNYVGNYKFIYNSIPYLKADFSQIKHGYFPRRNYRNFGMDKNREALGLERATAYLSAYRGMNRLGTVTYYGKILDLCTRYGIRPVLLRMPQSDEYRKHAAEFADIVQLDREVVILSEKHSSDFILLDFRDDFAGRPQYFFNADHVNPVGTAIITRKIKTILDSLEQNEHGAPHKPVILVK